MEVTNNNIITIEGFYKGSVTCNFPNVVIKNKGLVGTYSIHSPYTKTKKSSGLSEGLK